MAANDRTTKPADPRARPATGTQPAPTRTTTTPPAARASASGEAESRQASPRDATQREFLPATTREVQDTITTTDEQAQNQARRQQQRRDAVAKQEKVSREDAVNAARNAAPSVSVAAPNPTPRPAVTSAARINLLEPDVRPPARHAEDRVKVQATQLGYYEDTRRRPGDVFWIRSPEEFSERWMRVVADDTPEHTTMLAEALRQQHEDIRGMRRGATTEESVDTTGSAVEGAGAKTEESPKPATGDQDVLE